jgi:hypothetical protein
VGDIPEGYYGVRDYVSNNPNWEINKNPSTTQLYNAIKFSGRSNNKLGIGIFNAVAAPMEARLHNKLTGADTTIRTSVLTNYNIFVLDQALKGRSSMTLTNTNVMRDAEGRDANVSALDLVFYNKANTHAFNATGRYSKIWGLNPYDGYTTTLKFGKVSGSWRYFLFGNVESKMYDPNDLGILSAPNEMSGRFNLSYNRFKPTKHLIQYSYSLDNRILYLYNPNVYSRYDITASTFWIFKNFWDISIHSQLTPLDVHDYFELRTEGRYLKLPLNFYADFGGSTDSRKKLYIRFSGVFATAPDFDNNYYAAGLGFRFRFSNKVTFDLQMDGHKESNNLGYAFVREANGDPIVGFRDVKENINVLSGIYNITPRLNLTLRVRHYWNEIKYKSFHDVDMKGELVNRPFISNRNENVNIFNTDAFLTWDFRLGSRLIIGYKNWLGDEEYVLFNSNKNDYFRNLSEIFNLRHGNEVTVRFIYFLDWNQLRGKNSKK